MPGAGHFLPFEAPEAFLDALVPFLRDTPPVHTTADDFRDLLLSHDGAQPDPVPAESVA